MQIQQAAHTEYLRLLQNCIAPSNYLRKLRFDRALSNRQRSDTDQVLMILRMLDSASDTYCILYILQCSNQNDADFVVNQAQALQALQECQSSEARTCHALVQVQHVFSYTYQHFSTNGNLNECWPLVFLGVEDCFEPYLMTTLSTHPWPMLDPKHILDIMITVSIDTYIYIDR